jgi:hypothetical protein
VAGVNIWRDLVFGGPFIGAAGSLVSLTPDIHNLFFSFHFISFYLLFFIALLRHFSIGLGVVDTGTAGNLVSSSFLSPTCFLLEVDFSISTLYRSPGVSNEIIPIRAWLYFVFYCERQQSFIFFLTSAVHAKRRSGPQDGSQTGVHCVRGKGKPNVLKFGTRSYRVHQMTTLTFCLPSSLFLPCSRSRSLALLCS